MKTKIMAVIVIGFILLGLAISLTYPRERREIHIIETHASGSNFTQEAHEEWVNGSGFLLIPGGSMGNSVDVGDINSDGNYEIATVSEDMNAGFLQIDYQSSLRVWSYDVSSFNQLAEKVWKTDGSGPAGDTVVKIFEYGNTPYILTAGKDVYNNGPGLGSIRIWKYSGGSISFISNVSWRDLPGKNTTIKDVWVGDVNSDGNTEIITVGDIEWSIDNNTKNYSMAEITAWKLNSDMSMSFITEKIWSDDSNGTYTAAVDCYDFDGDGNKEIVEGGSYGFNDSGVERSKGQITIWNLNSGAFQEKDHVEWIDVDSCGVMGLQIYDINGDGNMEIIAAGANKNMVMAGEVSVWDSNLNQLARTQFYIDPEGAPSGSHWDCIGLGVEVYDFDEDGTPDIVVTGLSKGPHTGGTTFWAYLASFTFGGSSITMDAKYYWRGYDGEVMNKVVKGDVDGDGVEELIVFGYGWQTDSNGGNTYYAMLYSYVYQQQVPELSPMFLIVLISIFIPLFWRKR